MDGVAQQPSQPAMRRAGPAEIVGERFNPQLLPVGWA